MAFTRSLLTRLTEGLIRDFLANADVQAYWKTRFYKGPFVSDDPSIAVPQGTVLPAPGAAVEEPGVSGVNGNHILAAIIGIFEPIRAGALKIGATEIDEYDRLQLLKTIIAAGSDGNNQGKIIDPDNAGSGDPTQKYLNTDFPRFRDIRPRLLPEKAIFWSFLAEFPTRIDNLTLLRK